MKQRMRKQVLYAQIRVCRLQVNESYKDFGAAGLMLAAADDGHKKIARIHAPSVAESLTKMRNFAGES